MKFAILYSCDVELDLEQLWPDGDAPENPTPADVYALVQKDGGFYSAIRSWNLEEFGEGEILAVPDGGEAGGER